MSAFLIRFWEGGENANKKGVDLHWSHAFVELRCLLSVPVSGQERFMNYKADLELLIALCIALQFFLIETLKALENVRGEICKALLQHLIPLLLVIFDRALVRATHSRHLL